jgi:hypothetical protein
MARNAIASDAITSDAIASDAQGESTRAGGMGKHSTGSDEAEMKLGSFASQTDAPQGAQEAFSPSAPDEEAVNGTGNGLTGGAADNVDGDFEDALDDYAADAFEDDFDESAPLVWAPIASADIPQRHLPRGFPWRIVFAAFGGMLIVLVLGLVAALVVVPGATNGRAIVVTVRSMEPALGVGDVVVIRRLDAAEVCRVVDVGDIVALASGTATEFSRVAEITATSTDDCLLTMRGDSAEVAIVQASPAEVRGVFRYVVPWVGSLIP